MQSNIKKYSPTQTFQTCGSQKGDRDKISFLKPLFGDKGLVVHPVSKISKIYNPHLGIFLLHLWHLLITPLVSSDYTFGVF
jgi:hypothetical protein